VTAASPSGYADTNEVIGGSATTSTLTVSSSSTGTYSGTLGDGTATSDTNNPLALIKSGTGTFTLSGANTYTAGTSVSNGKLYINNASGSGTGTGNVTVSSGATLAGSGAIAPASGNTVTIASGGKLSSGGMQVSDASDETITGTGLSLTNATTNPGALLNISGGSTLQFALGEGTDTGDFNFADPNTASTYMTVNGNATGEIAFGLGSAINVNLVDLTALYSPQLGSTTLQLRYENPVLLISAGLDSDYANLVTTGGLDQNGYVLGVGTSLTSYTAFDITVSDINGTSITSYNDLSLYLYNGKLEVIPEPSTWALMLGGLFLLVFIQSRKNKRG
jgi:autotransporter-associated beta strand protein